MKGSVIAISVVAALGGLLFGFDTAVISGAIPAITTFFHLDSFSLGWAVGAVLIGCGMGAFFAGRLADKYGRKAVLLACAVLFAVSGVGTALADSLGVFVSFRITGGLGVGAAAMVSPMYIAEIAPPAWRGRLVAMYQLAIVTGILCAYLSSYGLEGVGENNWRWMFALQTAPSAVFGILLCFVPESPRWLVGQQRKDQAFIVLTRMGNGATARALMDEIEWSFTQGRSKRFREVFKGAYWPVVSVGILLAIFQQVTGINAIIYYAPVIFKQTGLGDSSSLLQTVSIGVVNFIATCVAIAAVDKWGRRRLLLTGTIVMGLMLMAIGLCFKAAYFDHYWILIFTLLYVAAFGCTLGAVVWVYLAEIFPNSIRGLGLSAATLALWGADFLVTYTFPIMNGKLGIGTTFFVYAALCLVAFVYVLAKVKETAGRSLEEIETLFI